MLAQAREKGRRMLHLFSKAECHLVSLRRGSERETPMFLRGSSTFSQVPACFPSGLVDFNNNWVLAVLRQYTSPYHHSTHTKVGAVLVLVWKTGILWSFPARIHESMAQFNPYEGGVSLEITVFLRKAFKTQLSAF